MPTCMAKDNNRGGKVGHVRSRTKVGQVKVK